VDARDEMVRDENDEAYLPQRMILEHSVLFPEMSGQRAKPIVTTCVEVKPRRIFTFLCP
jgi:hypothetical protein